MNCYICGNTENIFHDRTIVFNYGAKSVKEHEVYTTCKKCGTLTGGSSKCLEINGVKLDENV
jgi:hypothetical protein